MTFGSLFSGIGGMDLGLERSGLECRWQVENDPYCQKVLAKHWPAVKRYGDIRTVHGTDLEPVDLVCGGFPCQDLSQAGKRAGIEGTRSGLWFEFARLVRELRPRWVLIENVAGLLVYDGMRRVIGELARLGYVGCWRSLRAAEFGASHRRKRVFIVAYGPSRGFGKLRQPSGSNGFADRSHAQLGNPTFLRQSDISVHAEHHESGPEPESDIRARNTSTPSVSPLADAECTGLEVRNGQREQYLQQAPESLAPGLPAFAPGPADPRWPDILRERPDLAPALANPVGRRNSRRLRSGLHDNGPHGATGEVREPAGAGLGGNAGDGSAPSQPEIRGVADGLPGDLDGAMRNRTKRLGRLGNAVVPQIAEWIGEKILKFDS